MMQKMGRVALGGSPARAAARSMSTFKIEFPGAFVAHRCEAPDAVAETSKEELMGYFKQMYTMRVNPRPPPPLPSLSLFLSLFPEREFFFFLEIGGKAAQKDALSLSVDDVA